MLDSRAAVLFAIFATTACSSSTTSPSGDAASTTDGAGDAAEPVDLSAVQDGFVSSSADLIGPSDLADPVDPRTPKVLLIGLDGVRYDTLVTLDIPTLRALGAKGLFSRTWIYANPMSQTMSGPGWSTLATGVWPDKHQVRENLFVGHKLADYPDFMTRLESVAPALQTYVIADWPQVASSLAPGPVFGSGVDVRVSYNADLYPGGWDAADARVTSEAEEYLRASDPDVAFVYLGNPDAVAHSVGAGTAYRAAIESADTQVATLLAAIEARPSYALEDWLVIVTTDHGHRDGGGHGGATWQERQSFVIAAGGAIVTTTPSIQPRLVDIVPTIFSHLGVSIPSAWGFDGVPLTTTSTTDPFDSLLSDLQGAVDEMNIDASIVGWTPTAPPQWSVDNSAMTGGGVTEWRGWSFVDEAFWSEADSGQGREAFVRSRGVIAVADPDEWDDLGSPSQSGTFDSTLVSSPYDVAGRTTVRLRFASHYRQEGMQKASVLVSFDGGASQTVLHYDDASASDNGGGDVISQIESIDVTVPSGAATMVVRWRLYDARNNWFWAIDDPRVD